MNPKRTLRAGENAFTWFLLVFSLIVLVLAYRISGFRSVSSPGAFPMIAAMTMVVSMVMVLIGNRRLEKPAAGSVGEELRSALRNIFPLNILIYIGIILGYMVLIEPLTFLPSSFAFLFISTWYLKGSSPLKALLISAVSLGLIHLIFHTIFKVILP